MFTNWCCQPLISCQTHTHTRLHQAPPLSVLSVSAPAHAARACPAEHDTLQLWASALHFVLHLAGRGCDPPIVSSKPSSSRSVTCQPQKLVVLCHRPTPPPLPFPLIVQFLRVASVSPRSPVVRPGESSTPFAADATCMSSRITPTPAVPFEVDDDPPVEELDAHSPHSNVVPSIDRFLTTSPEIPGRRGTLSCTP